MSKLRDHRVSSRPAVDRAGARAMAVPTAPRSSNNDQNHRSKSSHKIPREIRYDLENALLGLCDVWFDEIKPHLVKNKLKVHTGGALRQKDSTQPRMPPERRATKNERGNIEPGAASDLKSASCNVSSQTRRAASKEQSCRQPAPTHPRPTSPVKIRNLLQVSNDERTPEVQRAPAWRLSPEQIQTYQLNFHDSSKENIKKRKSRKKSSTQKESQSPISIKPFPSRTYPYCATCASNSPSSPRSGNVSPHRFPSLYNSTQKSLVTAKYRDQRHITGSPPGTSPVDPSIKRRNSRKKSSIQEESQSPISTEPFPSRIYPYCTTCASNSPSNSRFGNVSPQRFPSRNSTQPSPVTVKYRGQRHITGSPPRTTPVDPVVSKSPKSQRMPKTQPKSNVQQPINTKPVKMRNLHTLQNSQAVKKDRKKELRDDTYKEVICEKTESLLILYKNPNREISCPSIMCLAELRKTKKK